MAGYLDEQHQKILQECLDRITANTERWRQSSWASVPGGVDDATHAQRTDDGTWLYHGFEIPEEYIIRSNERVLKLPVADCGTSFCLAGDACVNNGWVFVGFPGDGSSGDVIKVGDLPSYLNPDINYYERNDFERSAESEGARLLGLFDVPGAMAMFNAGNSLLTLWAMAYALTEGTITLPDGLPEVVELGDAAGDYCRTSEAIPAGDLLRAIKERIDDLYQYESLEFIEYYWAPFADEWRDQALSAEQH